MLDTRCQFGGDNLGVAVEEQNDNDRGMPPHPRRIASGRQQGAGWLGGDVLQYVAVQIGRGEILQYVSVGKTEVGDGRMMARGAAERGRGELGEQDCRVGAAGSAAVAE